jgi:2-keto-4-pentenoate hydratase/2-oxohepta-3-ene-1,7-dioic acid hydratase in catechol pathway
MKLATILTGDGPRAAVVDGDDVLELSAVAPELPTDMVGVLEGGAGALDRIREAVSSGGGARRPLAEVALTAPVRPRKFWAIGLNYADHIAESGLSAPENLPVFAKATTSVTGPYDDVQRPAVSDMLDYEGELGFVIGRRCRHVSAADAPEVIAGYLVVNDFSVRDWQVMTPQWNLGKSFDTHGPIGPWIVTADELGDPHTLDLRTYVNAELRQSSNTRNLIFDCFRQVEIISQVCTLEPGDVIATGTPSGIAAGLEGQPWLTPGDRVRVEIDRIGAIENQVVQEQTDGALVRVQLPSRAHA